MSLIQFTPDPIPLAQWLLTPRIGGYIARSIAIPNVLVKIIAAYAVDPDVQENGEARLYYSLKAQQISRTTDPQLPPKMRPQLPPEFFATIVLRPALLPQHLKEDGSFYTVREKCSLILTKEAVAASLQSLMLIWPPGEGKMSEYDKIPGEPPAAENIPIKLKWVTEWILAEETTEKELSDFLLFATGRRALDHGQLIYSNYLCNLLQAPRKQEEGKVDDGGSDAGVPLSAQEAFLADLKYTCADHIRLLEADRQVIG